LKSNLRLFWISGKPNLATGLPPPPRIASKRAKAAKARTEMLLATEGVRVIDSGEVDRFDRPLVWVKLPDGRTIGSILISEKLARRWTPDYRADWC